MKTIELIRWAMQLSDDAVNRLVVGLESQPLLQPTPKGAIIHFGSLVIWR